jgi:hypothetical protein
LGCIIGLVGFALAIAFAPTVTIIWDGGFSSQEYQLTILDEQGRPVSGVTLRVQSQGGDTSYFYPINEFLPDQTPTSDSDGRMIFHHVANYLEFSGRDHCNFFGLRIWSEGGAPQFDCIFLRNGQEVSRLHYNQLRLRFDDERKAAKVKRAFPLPGWPRDQSLLLHQDYQKLSREQRISENYLSWMVDKEERMNKKEIEFPIFERTITIPSP